MNRLSCIASGPRIAQPFRRSRENPYPNDSCNHHLYKPIFNSLLGIDTKRRDETKHSDVRLSARESVIVRMMGDGLSNKSIARQLSIAPETVKSHAKNIFWKLTARSRAEAVYRAVALGLI